MWAKIIEMLHLSIREVWAFEKLFEYLGNAFSSFSIKGFVSWILAVAEILQMLIFGLPLTPRGQELDLTGYSLVMYDEFDGDALNADIWQTRGNGARRGGYSADSQVEVRDGNMVITGEYLADGEYGEGWYTAQSVVTLALAVLEIAVDVAAAVWLMGYFEKKFIKQEN